MTRTRTRSPHHPVRWFMIATAVAVGSTLALSAWSMPGGPHPGGPGMGGPGMGLFGGPMSGPAIDHMLDGLNATDAQRSQIKQIAEAASNDLRGQREQRRTLHERMATIFAAPTVDAAAAEQVRAQLQALNDQASKRMTTAMLDASKVLTPEQRARLGERMKQRSAAAAERMQRMERQGPPGQRP